VETYNEIFSNSQLLLEKIKEADELTKKVHGTEISLQRAIFLSWWCAKADCKFCYMSTQKERITEPEKAKRKLSRIFAEAEICRALNFDIEFLSGGYGSFSIEEIKSIAERIRRITSKPVWLNVGVLNKKELGIFGEEVEGIVGSVETMNPELRKALCPSKPLKPIEKMLEEAKSLGFKTGMTIILGLGEKVSDLPELFDFIRKNKIDRITYYSLNPHKGTPLENYPSPASLYQAGVIALTRAEFPEIEIIGGTWIDQLPNIGIMLLAGANGITKYPFLAMFGNRYGKKLEEEVKFAGRKLKGSFTNKKLLENIKTNDEEVGREIKKYLKQLSSDAE